MAKEKEFTPLTPEENERFEQLWATASRRVHSLCTSKLRYNLSDVDDAVQKTRVRAYQAFGRFREGTPKQFGSWVLKIADRLCIDYDRYNKTKLKRTSSLATTAAMESGGKSEALNNLWDSYPNPGKIILNHTIPEYLCDALGSLTQEQKKCLLLFANGQGHTMEEIADLMGITINTAKGHLSGARKNMKRHLSRETRHSNEIPVHLSRLLDPKP